MNIEEIKELLPHRKPMLLVDEVTLDGEVATGYYKVTGDEYFVQGHFPGNPVVPGVILCEIMAQTCCILFADAVRGNTPFFTGIDKVKFKNQVKPGDTVCITAKMTRNKGIFYFTSCEAHVDGKLCAKGDLSFAIVEGR